MNERNKILLSIAVAGLFILLGFAGYGGMANNTLSGNQVLMPANSGTATAVGYAGECGKDVFGVTVIQTCTEATWSYSCSTGSLVHEYKPAITIKKANWNIISWTDSKTGWTTDDSNHIAYGDFQYHWGIWYIHATQSYYCKITVSPNSWGGYSTSYGSGCYC